jgi:hypothetical protein
VQLIQRTTDATVVLPEYNRSFTSMPALFGGELGYNDPPVMAHLTLIKEWPTLCHRQQGEDGGDENDYQSGGNEEQAPDSATIPSQQQQQQQPQFSIDFPDDGLPVALLVERGQCTFYEKAMVAQQYFQAVQYLVVYDNEMSPDLVPMSSEHPTNVTLLFVSNMSGEGTYYDSTICKDAKEQRPS